MCLHNVSLSELTVQVGPGHVMEFLKYCVVFESRQAVGKHVIHILCPDMGQFDATKGKQALEIRSSLSERRALTDPILPGDSGDHAHRLQWAKAHGMFNKVLKMFV